MFRHAKRLLFKNSEQTAKQLLALETNDNSTLNAPVRKCDDVRVIEPASYQPVRPLDSLRDAASEPSVPPPPVGREYGLKVLVSQPLEKRNVVDIIAIHGLNGHREKTWTDKTTRVNWLSDTSCLPKDIPNARVFTFGYNSVSYFSRSDSDVQDFASELLAEIKAHRRSDAEKHRPIVFICHSLGGLVFKQAIVRAHEQNKFYSSLLESIQGVIFFATPHKGSSLAFWDLIGTRIAQAAAFGFTTNPKLSKDLKVNSEMLNHISNSFVYRGWNIKIRSFYETEFMPHLNCRVVDKDSAVLGWGNELDIASTANHSSICKFASATDHRYQTAIDAILDVIYLSDETTEFRLGDRELSCISRLNLEYEHHLDQVDDPVSGTCEWLLSHKKWQQWQSWPYSSLLWITSNAGCGKSVMAKFLVNYFKNKRGANSAQSLGYFFFMDGIAGQDNAAAAVSGLLHQLYYSQHGLIKHALHKLEGSLSHVRFSTLWQIFVDSINDESAKDVLWILDGVDECEAQSLRQFMRAMSAFFESHTATKGSLRSCNLKVVLLSRPSSLIQQALGLFSEKGSANGHLSNKLRLTGEDENQALTADILRFAHSKINELTLASALPENVLKRLQERLIAGADFTFLWISLVIKVVEDSTLNGISVIQLEKILNTTNLDNIYQQLLEGPSRAFPSKTRKLLSIILASVRPLTVDEMCVAIEVQEEYDTEAAIDRICVTVDEKGNESTVGKSTSYPKGWRIGGTKVTDPQSLGMLEKQLHKPFDNHIRQLCGHFVRIRCGKLYFVHQTARTFLASASFELSHNPTHSAVGGEPVPSDDSSRVWRPIKQDEAIHTLLNVCVNYIKIFTREGEGNELQMWDEDRIAQHLESCKRDPPRAFFPYAAVEWVRHYRSVREMLNSKYDELLQPGTKLFNIWIKAHSSWREEHTTRSGAKQINKKADNLQIPAMDAIWELGRQFEEFEEWFSGKWHITSTSEKTHEKTHENIKELRHQFAQNPKFHTLREFFDQEEWAAETGSYETLVCRVEQMQRLFVELIGEWSQAINKYDDHKIVLQNSKRAKYIKSTAHVQAIVRKMDMERQLLEALMHFDLLNLSEAWLEGDGFLYEYWQSRSCNGHHQKDGEGGEEEPGGDGGGGIAYEGSIPDWIKHYIREKNEVAMAGNYAVATPGVHLPGLSNPETRSFDDSVGLRLASRQSRQRLKMGQTQHSIGLPLEQGAVSSNVAADVIRVAINETNA